MRRCLIVGPSWVGDMIMAQGLYRALRAEFPERPIDVLAPAWSGPILNRMAEVDRVIVSPFGHGRFDLSGRRALARELRVEAYDWAIVLPNSWKSALLPWLAHIPRRTGFVGEFRYGLLNDARRLDQAGLPRLVDRYRALAGAPPAGPGDYPRLMVDPAKQAASLARLGLSLARPVLALCPGAEYGPAKRWPEAHYAAVARAKLDQGWQVWLFGSASDRAVGETINSLAGGTCHNLAGATALEEVVDLLACAQAVVSNDSGLMHVAAAVAVPVVAVYGSTDPGYTPPLSEQARVVRLGLECSPCFKRECPLGHLDCLAKLEPGRVLAEL
ncbi:MAG: lipopolysaccharide heptosyltransferase II [Hydrogenophilaceae bacterium CG1_02_62_390]|nr:MAG: lipopolysaccharide heptosyltransferase II [Hydrogenophilaceae bacterium CG1_02_62_390]PIW38403.1 MAG: lipopolysaccharide heptosyltransferase II [Hydrogenophilales bacterium CG15_BIG_FIL_POST_REV_8_21_14_020_62_31]PIW72113.1 MAG: lipopolysaccharide heptosyltransferase II [Hydrogenophilales bacterium CG12_big_fil_rev_8_21_14_0_65_61_21]